MFGNRQVKERAHERHVGFKCGSTGLDSRDTVLDGLYFYLMSAQAEMDGHQIVIFLIIDHNNDNAAKGGSDRLAEPLQDK